MSTEAGVLERAGSDRRTLEATELVLLAIGAELVFLAIALVPVAPFVLAATLFYGPRFATAAGVLMALGVWWLLQQRAAEPAGEPLPDDCDLRREIDALCRQLDAPRIDRVLLDDRLNAAAAASRGLLSLVGVRRTLVLGLPLLRVLDAQEVRAVIAHELGHFSRHHGRLGHWIYLVRSKWEVYLDHRALDGIDGTLQSVARQFVPHFLRRSSAWSRRCEFEADAEAAHAVGGAALASGLERLELVDHAVRHVLPARLATLCVAQPDPPADFWGVALEAASGLGDEEVAAAFQAASTRIRRLHDTHPPLAERLLAIGLQPRAVSWADRRCAGEDLLGAHWPALDEGCRERRRDARRRAWRLDHVRLRSVARRLAAPVAPAQRAMLQEQLAPSDATLAALRTAVEARPEEPLLLHALGEALLRRDDPAGCDVMRAAARLDGRLAPEASAAVARFQDEHGDDAAAMRAGRQAAQAARKLDRVREQLWTRLMAAPQAATEVDREALAESVAASDAVDAAWVLATDVPAPTGPAWRVVLLVLRLDAEVLLTGTMDDGEDELRAQWRELLQSLLPANVVARVHTVLTTEALNPNLLARLEAEGSCLKRPTRPLNAGVVKIDVL